MHRIPLEPGTLLKVNEASYLIKRCLSRGGYSLVYEAEREGMETGKKIVIKEFFPFFAHRECGKVVPVDISDVESFQKLRERIKMEGLLSGDAGNYTYQVLPVEDVDTENGYIVMGMNSTDMVSLAEYLTLLEDREYLPPSKELYYKSTDRVRYALKIVSSILAGLHAIHEKAHILHCDLSPYNVYWAGQDIRTGLHCEAFFLDFGSAVKIQENKKLLISEMENIPKSMVGYGAPEKQYTECVELTPAADLYSVAVLLAVLCCGSSICKDIRNWIPCDMTSFRNRLLKTEISKLSLEPNVKKELISIIVKGIQKNPEERYQSALEMQEDILHFQNLCVPKEAQLQCKAPDPIQNFVGREKELQELKNLLEKGYHTIFITGTAGLGKTELALKLAQELKADYGVYQTYFSDSLEQTIINLPVEFKGDFDNTVVNTNDADQKDFTEKDRKDLYKRNYECLKQYRSSDILIIDNFDFPPSMEKEMLNSREYQDLLKLDMKIIFTSRVHVTGTSVRLKELSNRELLQLMKNHYNGEGKDDSLQELINIVAGHTLTVELMAKIMENSWGEITPEIMIQVLKNQEYEYAGFEPVVSGKDGDYEERHIYEHLKRLFRMAMLDESSRNIMSQSVLLPQNGLTAFLFLKCHEEKEKKIIRGLEKGGWLHKTSDNLLKLHPLIREVCCRELEMDDVICEKFLYPYRLYLNENYEKMPIIYRTQAAEVFGNASVYLEDVKGVYTRLAAEFYDIAGQYKKSLEYYLKFNETKLSGMESVTELVSLNEKIAGIYYDLGKYEEALEYEEKMLALLRNDFEINKKMIARIYHNCSNIYKEKGDHQAALQWILKAEAMDDDECHQAYVSMNRGKIDFRMGNYESARNLCEEALEFFGREPMWYYMELASIATTLGMICEEYQEYEEAARYYEFEKDIYVEKLGADHPMAASSYNDLGYALIKLGRYEDALEYLEDSCRIKEREYGMEHRYTANTYHTLGQVHICLDDCEKALEYCEKAGMVRWKLFGPESPEMADSLSLYTDIYEKLGDYETAFQCAQRVFEIYRAVFFNHPRTKWAWQRMQQIYQKLISG